MEVVFVDQIEVDFLSVVVWSDFVLQQVLRVLSASDGQEEDVVVVDEGSEDGSAGNHFEGPVVDGNQLPECQVDLVAVGEDVLLIEGILSAFLAEVVHVFGAEGAVRKALSVVVGNGGFGIADETVALVGLDWGVDVGSDQAVLVLGKGLVDHVEVGSIVNVDVVDSRRSGVEDNQSVNGN